MAYAAAIPLPGFSGGLNLRDKVDATDANQAIDLLNVSFTEVGAVKQRDGYAALGSALTNNIDSIEPFYKTDGTKRMVVGCGTRVEVVDTGGAVVASGSLTGMTSGKIWDFARFGSPGTEQVFAGNGTDTIQRWDESSHWTSGAALATVDGAGTKAMPKAGALCVQSPDNRLVAAGYSTTSGGPDGGTTNPSYIYFSEPGDPLAWTSNNFIELRPGDGEAIQAVVAWREFVFAFKETSFYVFFGNSTDSAGNPVFNYRPVEAGQGLASPRAYAVAPEGIYFMSRDGIYLTTGQEPKLISNLIDPIWSGGSSTFYKGGELQHSTITNTTMAYHDHRLYVGFTTTGSTNDKTLVFDSRIQAWSLYDFAASALASFRIDSNPELVFASAKHLYRHNSTYTSDNGAATSSRWRSGWFDYGWITRYGRAYNSPSQKVIRTQKMWGVGKTLVGLSTDFQAGGVSQAVDMTSPAVEGSTFGGDGTFGGAGYFGDAVTGLQPALVRKALRGTVFSVSFSNSILNQSWSIDRYEILVRSVRRPGVTITESVAS